MAGPDPVRDVHPFLNVLELGALQLRCGLAQLHADTGVINLDAVLEGRLPQRRQVLVGGVWRIGEPVDRTIQPIDAPIRKLVDQVFIGHRFRRELRPVRVGDQPGAKAVLRFGLAAELRCGGKCRKRGKKLSTVHREPSTAQQLILII